uniref:Microcephalin n=1 Tax=Sipha flava TaxID=143950 RepID=A0A2S2PWA9_9HEMI
MSEHRTPYPRKDRKRSPPKKCILSSEPCDVDIFDSFDSQMKMIEDAQSSEQYTDLFGAVIPTVERNTSASKTESNQKTLVTKIKRKPKKNIVSSNSLKKPLPQRITKDMNVSMGITKKASDVSALSTGSLNVSGVQRLDESISNLNYSKNEKESSEILKGVVAFMDYKIKNDQLVLDIIKLLNKLGAKVENTFNYKVTHVLFHDGSLETYKTAIERKIPMVTEKWVKYSNLAEKMMDPFLFPPVDVERYTKVQEKSSIIQNSNEHDKSIRQSNNEKKIQQRTMFTELSERIDICRQRFEKTLQTPELKTPVKNPNKIMDGLSEHLYSILNDPDHSSIFDTEVVPECYLPLSIKILRKYVIPEETKNKTLANINRNLIGMENHMKLNLQARQRLRRLLFSSNNDLNNTSLMTDIPSPSQITRIKKPTRKIKGIACTGFTKEEVKTLKLSIQSLGTFTFQTNVEHKTIYLITKSQSNRTLNMVYAMAYGCYIVSENWVHESLKMGKWLSYSDYLISGLSSPVKDFQFHSTLDPSEKLHIFDEAGSIYLSNVCDPSANHLKRLVRACGGKCTTNVNKANIVVGYTPLAINTMIHEMWILDCITQGTLLDENPYRIRRCL